MNPRLARVMAGASLGPLLLLASNVAGAAPSSTEMGRSMPARADRDGDKIFDDLEARLVGRPKSDRIGVVVVLRKPATNARVARLRRELGGFAVERRFSVVPGFSARVTPHQVARLASRSEVVHVEEDSTVQAALDSAQTSFGTAKARIDAGVDGDADGDPGVYSKDDLVAAVVDSGIDAGHPDLDEGKVIAFKDFTSAGLTTPYDDHGHGTTVASVLAGDGDGRADKLYRGVAPGAALVGVKVLDRNGNGTIAGVAAAIDWVVANRAAHGIEALNLSLQTSGCSDGTDVASLAVNAAEAAGLVVTAAAGNLGPGTCTIPSPGAAAGAITAGAMADLGAGGFSAAPFSSRGPTVDGRIKPDISAPGVNLTAASAGSGYGQWSGTSLSAPFVAGVALLLKDANPALGPAGIRALITATAVDWGAAGVDTEYGAGRLDAYAAVEAAAGREIGEGPQLPAHETYRDSLGATGDADEYALDVADAGFPVAATLLIQGIAGPSAASPNFDVELLDPAGAVVRTSASTSRQETIGYTPAAAGRYLLRVRSSNGSGSYVLDVSAGLAILVLPANTAPPEVHGAARDGETLTSTDGFWGGSEPLTLSRHWERCDAAGQSCSAIPSATGPAYTLASADVGATLRVIVTAVNPAGSASAASEPTAQVAAAPPFNTARPEVAGVARAGETLTATSGEWAGTRPLALSRRWERCDAAGGACTPIPAAVETSYEISALDVGATLRVVVRAENGAGTEEASSEPTTAVLPAPALPPPRIRGARAFAVGHKVVVRARTLECARCSVKLRLRFRGGWHTYRLERAVRLDRDGSAAKSWSVAVRGVPSGRRAWYVRATDRDTGASVRTEKRWIRVR